MARTTLDRVSDDIADKFEMFQEWLHGASKNLPSSKQMRSYLPYQKPERSIVLPIALVLGGLALIGAITLLSTTNVRTLKNVTPFKPKKKEEPEAKHDEDNAFAKPLAAE